MLDQTATQLDRGLQEVTSYKTLQELISHINQKNAQQGLTNQSESDLNAYKTLYDALNSSSTDQLDAFYVIDDEQLETGVLAAFKRTVEDFREEQEDIINKTVNNIKELEEQAADIEEIRATIAQDYYADRSKTPETAKDDDVKKAILNLADIKDENQSRLAQRYLDNLKNRVLTLPVTSLELLIEKLYKQKFISLEQYRTYQNEIKIIQRYATGENIPVGQQQQFTYFKAEPNTAPGPVTYTHTLTLALETNGTQEITFETKPGQTTKPADLTVNYEQLIPVIEDQLNKEFERRRVLQRAEVKYENKRLRVYYEDRAGAQPRIPVTINPTITWQFPVVEDAPYQTVEYQWKVNWFTLQNTGAISAYREAEGVITKKDFPGLMKPLQELDQIAQNISTIFGSPSDNTLGVNDFANRITMLANRDKTIRELTSQDAIYFSYDNLTPEGKKLLISDSLVEQFTQQAAVAYQAADNQHKELLRVIGPSKDGTESSLTDVHRLLTDPERFLHEAEKLYAWYVIARSTLENSYAEWKENPTLVTDIKEYAPHSNREPNDDAIYYEEKTGNQLHQQFSSLIENSITQALSTRENAAQIESLENQFKSMTQQTENVKKDSENILQKMDVMVDESTQNTGDNTQYAENFNTVMSNARQGGKPNPTVFNFLSDPLAVKERANETQKNSILPYLMTIIGMLIMLGGGYGIKQVNMTRRLKETDKLTNQSRAWKNMPMTAFSIGAAGVFGLAFSFATAQSNPGKNTSSWISFVTMVIMGGILLATFIWRQFPRTAVYIFGFLTGSYLLLTPILGISIEPRSFIEWVFRLSPLQNIENGYTALTQGQVIGFYSLIALIGLIALGVVLNLVATPTRITLQDKP